MTLEPEEGSRSSPSRKWCQSQATVGARALRRTVMAAHRRVWVRRHLCLTPGDALLGGDPTPLHQLDLPCHGWWSVI